MNTIKYWGNPGKYQEINLNKTYSKIFIFVIIIVLLVIFLPTQLFSGEAPLTIKPEARDLYNKALTLYDNAQIEKARELFIKVTRLDDQCAMAYYNLASLGITARNNEDYIKKALSLKDKVSRGEKLLIEARNASLNNNPKLQEKLLSELVQLYPDDKRAHSKLGYCFWRQGKESQAIEEFQKSIELDNNFAVAYNNLGYIYRNKEQYKEAEGFFKKYIALIPDMANPYNSMGDLYTKMGEFQLAIENYNKALIIDPSFVRSKRNIGDDLIFMGYPDEAGVAYRQADQLTNNAQEKITNHLRLVTSYLYRGEKNMAIKEINNVIKETENANLQVRKAYLLTDKIWLLLETGKIDEARNTRQELTLLIGNRIFPEFIMNDLNKLMIYQDALISSKSDDFNMAKEKLAQYTKLIEQGNNPKEIQKVHELTGLIALDEGKYDLAINELKMCNLQSAYNLFKLAVANQKAGHTESASNYYKKAANWNQNGFGYALIRNDAHSAIAPIASDD